MRGWRHFVRHTLHTVGLLAAARALLGRNADGSLARHSINNTSAARPEDSASSSSEHSPALVEALVDRYQQRLAAEQDTFSQNINVHDLPAIYHYWSNKYLLPTHQPFGFTCPDSFFSQHLTNQLIQAETNGKSGARFVSVGAGNCDTEVRLASNLLKAGHRRFVIECLDINSEMLARGSQLARDAGVSANVRVTKVDFNFWKPNQPYDAVIANQSLHHVDNLEGLFERIRDAMSDASVFLTSDMIGRNGHQRWPEALELVQQFWQELPGRYRYNLQLNRFEDTFENWDCSQYGFEGIRAQDVLPLLIKNFHFEAFFAFANIIDPFIDRGFGHHFDPAGDWDRKFIDRVAIADEQALHSGVLKPTHVLAAMRKVPCALKQHIAPFTPSFCVRIPG